VRRSWLQLSALLAMSIVATPAYAFECKLSETYSYVSLSWSTRLIRYGIQKPGPTKISPELGERAVRDAFEQWTVPECTDVRFEDEGEVAPEIMGVNQVVFQPDNWKYARDAVALTRTTYGTEDGVIRSATIEVNEATFDFLDAAAGCSPQMPAYDITAVLTHEVGHLLGLDHTKMFSHAPTDPTMAPEVGPCEMDKRSIEPDDIGGLCLLYPAGEPPGRCERIPAQADPYVGNAPFGCSATGSPDESLLPFLALVAVFSARFSRGAARRAARLGRRKQS
jgi:hypothetical protein